MAASYPGAIKSFTTKVNLVDTIDAADVNDLQLEVAAVETELGIDPRTIDDTVTPEATPADVADVLDQFANALKVITGAANWYSPVAALLESDFAAKGDLISASADDTPSILPVGGNNRIMRANSGATPGLSWDKRQYVQLEPFSFVDQTDCATGNGKAWLHVPAHLAGLDLVEIHAENETAGTTGTMDIQIRNATQAADMLTTVITIDTGETGSDTAATPAVIDGDNDDVAENDMIAIDVDVIHTTAAKGLIITLGFA